MKELLNIEHQEFGHIGKNSQITGSLNFYGATYCSGKIHGEVKMLSDAPLIIERDGMIDGDIDCFDLEVYGTILGKIESKGNVTIYSCAKITGDIKATNLIIKAGAEVNIDCQTQD